MTDVTDAVRLLRANAAYCAIRAEGAERARWLGHVAAYDEVLTLWDLAAEDGPVVAGDAPRTGADR